MEGFLMVFVLSVAMFLGCYISGIVPLAVSFSESKLRLVTVFGAGLLVGTALSVIIPEGVGSIYDSETDLHTNSHGAAPHEADHILEKSNVPSHSVGKMPDKPPGIHLPPEKDREKPSNLEDSQAQKEPEVEEQQHVDEQQNLGPNIPQEKLRQKRNVDENMKSVDGVLNNRKLMTINEATQQIKPLEGDVTHGSHEHIEANGGVMVVSHSHGKGLSGHVNMDVHTLIGLALVVGFVFMLIVDQVGRGGGGRDVEFGLQPRYKITATVGLVVHAAADGIALGAASTTKHAEIQFIVFVAIMLHKAPAAFGLVSFLMYEGLEKSRIRRHLLVFALAAPIMAVITYIGISHGGSETLSSVKSTGVLMLFSAGTFLYVATVHVLPEIVNRGEGGSPSSSGGGLGHSHAGGGGGFKLNELVALVVGAMLPSVLTFGHSHGH